MNIDRTRLFDQRVVQRNIRAGRVTKDEYQAWLGELSDASENIKPRDEGGDEDGYEAAAAAGEPAPADAAADTEQALGTDPVAPPVAPVADLPPSGHLG